jgi:rod shape-determining protein MreC
LNVGSDKGLKQGDPIFQNGFLIGRIVSVEDRFAWAELVTSSSMMIPVVVEETRDLGVVMGDGEGRVWLHYVPERMGVEVGMTLSTALVSDQLPPGLRIGYISGEILVMPNGHNAWRVNLGADLSRLYAVSLRNRLRGGGQTP